MTFLQERTDGELTIIAVMGYPGHFGLKEGDTFVNNRTAWMLGKMSERSKARANIVIFDSPSTLHGVSARSNSDHLARIESVVEFYKARLRVPVWLFGHSDGSISVSEYQNSIGKTEQSIAGVILSSGRDETQIRYDWKSPALVLHHEKDGCKWTTLSGAKLYFSRIKKLNSGQTEFATVVGGGSSLDPCSTGYHMYEGAFEETLNHIEDFIVRNNRQTSAQVNSER